MTRRALKKLEAWSRATARYSPAVQKKLSKGDKNAAVVHSAAKYYVALKKLAEK